MNFVYLFRFGLCQTNFFYSEEALEKRRNWSVKYWVISRLRVLFILFCTV